MYRFLGEFIARFWVAVIVFWLVAAAVIWTIAPSWESVTKTGEAAFLPENVPSRRGEQLFREAFPLDYSGSNVALVLWREQGQIGGQDKDFIKKDLVPGLGEIPLGDNEEYPITTIRTLAEEGMGALLVSPDKKATLVVVELNTSFQDRRNIALVAAVEDLIGRLQRDGKVPGGLQVGVTGSATAGRDLDLAEAESVAVIEFWTIAVVVVLLLLLYRAPLVAVIPLATVFVTVTLGMGLLSMIFSIQQFAPARDLRVFVTVLAYGAGVDYCLFLIARYREELEKGTAPVTAVANAIAGVGTAITASAATVIAGIGMLVFAQFGKIHEAGYVIPFALTITLLGTLSFAPALLCLAGRYAFWPRCVDRRPEAHEHDMLHRFLDEGPVPTNFWHRLGPVLLRHSGAIWLGTVLVLLPFVIVALLHYDETNFNPLSDLPQSAPSAAGNSILEKHFARGALGPVVVLVRNDQIDFTQKEGLHAIQRLSDNLRQRMNDGTLADVRSLAHPLGVSEAAANLLAHYRQGKEDSEDLARRARGYYVSQTGSAAVHVTRVDVTMNSDPMSQRAISGLDHLEKALGSAMPAELRGSQVEFVGATASIRDLSTVKQADQRLIQFLVSGIVLLLLVILLRRLVVSVYLIVSVLFSYLATLGITYLVFHFIFAADFAGLDWKVPIFLFTILVAVGEDYNIFLLTRVKEERHHHGPLAAIPVALAQTGRVISSCGFIMAGTFASLLAGSLRAMWELGFALALGVLLDTLVVRPILVPAFLVLLQRYVPGRLGRYMALGARERAAVIG